MLIFWVLRKPTDTFTTTRTYNLTASALLITDPLNNWRKYHSNWILVFFKVFDCFYINLLFILWHIIFLFPVGCSDNYSQLHVTSHIRIMCSTNMWQFQNKTVPIYITLYWIFKNNFSQFYSLKKHFCAMYTIDD